MVENFKKSSSYEISSWEKWIYNSVEVHIKRINEYSEMANTIRLEILDEKNAKLFEKYPSLEKQLKDLYGEFDKFITAYTKDVEHYKTVAEGVFGKKFPYAAFDSQSLFHKLEDDIFKRNYFPLMKLSDKYYKLMAKFKEKIATLKASSSKAPARKTTPRARKTTARKTTTRRTASRKTVRRA